MIEDALICDVVQRSFGVVSTKQQVNLEVFDVPIRILWLRDMNERFEHKRSVRYSFVLESPFGLLENIFEEQKLKSIEEKFFCQSAEEPLNEES